MLAGAGGDDDRDLSAECAPSGRDMKADGEAGCLTPGENAGSTQVVQRARAARQQSSARPQDFCLLPPGFPTQSRLPAFPGSTAYRRTNQALHPRHARRYAQLPQTRDSAHRCTVQTRRRPAAEEEGTTQRTPLPPTAVSTSSALPMHSSRPSSLLAGNMRRATRMRLT